MVAAFFLDISQFSVDSPLSKAYPPSKHDCPLPSTCWVDGLQASILFLEEIFLLEQHHLLAFTNTCLSSGSLASSSVAHGPIPLSKPFIPIIAPHSVISFPREKNGVSTLRYCTSHTYNISTCVSVFSLAISTLLTLRHLGRFSNYSAWHPVPNVLRCDENLTVEISYRDSSGNFPAYFPLLYKMLEESRCPTF